MPTKNRKVDFANSEVVKRAEADAGGGSVRSASATRSSSTDTLTAPLTFFISACVCTFLFFANPYLVPFEAYYLINTALLIWIPLTAIILFFKQDVQLFGMSRGDKKEGLRYTAWAIVLMLIVLIPVSLLPEFRARYGSNLAQSLAIVRYAVRPEYLTPIQPIGLLYYEMTMGFYFFCWEFFFRGFMLFGLAKAKFLGNIGAVIVQALAFCLLHWSIVPQASKPPLEIASALVGGLILGALALRTKSFFYGFLIHWSIAFILDMLVVLPLIAHHT